MFDKLISIIQKDFAKYSKEIGDEITVSGQIVDAIITPYDVIHEAGEYGFDNRYAFSIQVNVDQFITMPLEGDLVVTREGTFRILEMKKSLGTIKFKCAAENI